MTTGLQVIPLPGMGEVGPGADLAALIASTGALQDGDVVVVASKVVAKAEGRAVAPAQGESTADARRRMTLEEEVLVETPHVVVVRTHHGYVCANAGIDASNTGGTDALLLLPADPDASAEGLRSSLAAGLRSSLAAHADVGVVISDTFGRAWREGQNDVALGVAGLPALRDERGTVDRDGRELKVTLVALADQVAGAADLVRDKAAGIPVVLVRGLGHLVGTGGSGGGAMLVRPPSTDLFPHGRGWLARRLATGEGAAVRDGGPTAWEWDLVRRAAAAAVAGPDGGSTPDDAVRLVDGALVTAEGRAAGRAESCLLDLGHRAEVSLHEGGYRITAG
ncbi:hypothetical protein BH23ACT9_BH23ACT9_39740 [soil metagenome]